MLKKIKQDNDLMAIASRSEIVDNKLWFQGYSIYRTAWCKKWIALLIFDPKYQGGRFNINYHYKQAVQDWRLHHLPLIDAGEPMPEPPRLFQFENAFKYINFYLPIEVKNHQKNSGFWDIGQSPLLRKMRSLLL